MLRFTLPKFHSVSPTMLNTLHNLLFSLSLVTVASIIIARSWNRFAYPQMLAEDGNTYFQDAYIYPFNQSIFIPYRRGFYVITRSLAELSLLFRLDLVPTIFMLFSLVGATLCCALFAVDAFDNVMKSRIWRVITLVVISFVPAMTEVALTITNMHWYLGILCFFLLLITLPETLWMQIVFALFWGLLFLSAPQLVLFVPCLVVRALVEKNGRVGFTLASLCAFVVSVFILILPSGNTTELTDGDLLRLPVGVLNGLALRVLAVGLFGSSLSFTWFWQSEASRLVYLLLVPYLIVNYIVARRFVAQQRTKPLFVQLYVNYCIIAPIALTLLGRPMMIPQSLSTATFWDGDRYFVLPIAALYFGVVWYIWSWWQSSKLTMALSLFIVVIFCLAAFRDLVSSARAPQIDFQWQQQIYRIYTAEASGIPSPVRIPSAPDQRWSLVLYSPKPFLPPLNALTAREGLGLGAFDNATIWSEQTDFPLVHVMGWADPAGCETESCRILVADVATEKVLVNTYVGSYRGDVVEVTKRSSLAYSGWQAVFPAQELSQGTHTLRAYVFDTQAASMRPLPGDLQIDIP